MKCTWVLMSGGANNNLRGFIDEVVPEVLLSKETTIMNVVCVCVCVWEGGGISGHPSIFKTLQTLEPNLCCLFENAVQHGKGVVDVCHELWG